MESPLLKEIRGTRLRNTGTKDVPWVERLKDGELAGWTSGIGARSSQHSRQQSLHKRGWSAQGRHGDPPNEPGVAP